MLQGHSISIKNEAPRDSTLIQTNIFEAFKNLKALSKNQQKMRLLKKNPLPIIISDESDSENEVTTKAVIVKSEEELLPFFFKDEDDSDDSDVEGGRPPKPKSSSKGNLGEMMVLNKPIACSTPLANKGTMSDDSDSTIIMDTSSEETFSNTTPNINILNNAGTSTCIEDDSDSTIIMENSSGKRIYIKHNILITPKTQSRTITNTFTNSKSTTDGNHNTVKENPRQVTQKSDSSLNPRKIGTDSKPGSSGHTKSVAKSTNPQTVDTSKVNVATSSNETNTQMKLGLDKSAAYNAETGAKNVGVQKTDLNKLEGASTEPSMNQKQKSETRHQRTLKSGHSGANSTSSQNVHQTATNGTFVESAASSSKTGGDQCALKSSGSDVTQTETKDNNSQKVLSNNNISSSSNVLQTPTRCNSSEASGSTTGKEKSIGSEQNVVVSPAIHPKEVSSTTVSIIPRTPTKHKLSSSPNTSPSKRANTPSPKKERGMNTSYLVVFRGLFSSVIESPYLRNLIEEETPVLKSIMSSDPKYFYVILKLFTWLPKRYNIFRFCTKILLDMEDKEVVKMYTFFQENGIVDVDFSKEDISILLNDLDREALKRVCEKFKLKRNLSGKAEMISALLKYCKTQSTLTFRKSAKELILDEVLLKMGKCVKLKNNIRDAFHKAFLLGTFTNPSFANMQDFFRSILFTKTVFPEYRIDDYCVFYTREEFTRYATARKFKDGLIEAVKNRNHIEVFQISETVYSALEKLENVDTHDRFKEVPHLKRFTAQSVYCSILSNACENLKTKYPSDVKKWLEYLIRIFPSSHRLGHWYYQLTWLYMRYLKPIDCVQAAKLLIIILQKKSDCVSEVQLHMLGERGEQLKVGTKLNKIDQLYHDTIAELVPEPIQWENFPQTTVDATAIRSNEIGKKRKYLVHVPGGDKNYLTVENIALEYYTGRCGYTGGIHCEGRLIKASFTLFFWDLIYTPGILVPGTFLSKYQEVPLDMLTPYFYTNRKDAIDKRLRDISSEWSDSKTIEFVKNSFDMHSHESGLCEPSIYIKDAEMLEILVNCIGREVLAKIYERLVKNVSQYSSGMPDLFLWNIEEKKSKFIEVKGENDKLSVKQNLWLKYLESIGAHIEVCIVHSIGSKRKPKVKCVTASESTIEEGTEKERASSTISSSSCGTTPRNKKAKPKSKKGPTPEKKPRISEETKEDNQASTSAKSISSSSCGTTPKNNKAKPKSKKGPATEKNPRTNEETKDDNQASTSAKSISSSSCGTTPKNKRKPKSEKGPTPEKKPRINEETKEDNQASTSAKTVGR